MNPEENLENFAPSMSDIDWLKHLEKCLKVGGVWISPKYGFQFRKTEEKCLELSLIATSWNVLPYTVEAIRRTILVGKASGITIKTDKTVEKVLIVR